VAPYPPLGATVPVHGSAATAPCPARPDPPQGTVIDSIRISDTTPLTEYNATLALTTYIEYTLRLTDALNPGVPRSWSRVTVTQESAERHLVIQRVKTFERAGGNVLQVGLRLTEQQSTQVTRLMDELKANERDVRFEWCWVELSLYNCYGEITDFGSTNTACAKISSATMMHLIAKRMPKAQFKPLDLYNSLMRPPPPPMPAANQAPVVIELINSRDRSRSRSRSRSERRYHDWISDTSSVSSLSSDDSSIGYVRRKLRKNKERKLARADRRYTSDSDEYESEDEDVIKIKLELKRGDDVVQSLLNIWTPQVEGKGKGKEKAV
jgi:hypothetical protein